MLIDQLLEGPLDEKLDFSRILENRFIQQSATLNQNHPSSIKDDLAEGLDRYSFDVFQAAVNHFSSTFHKITSPSVFNKSETNEIREPILFSSVLCDVIKKINTISNSIKNNSFFLEYQPTVKIIDNTLLHFEVLWRIEEDKSPMELIHLAEQVGLIEYLDYAVCKNTIDYISNNYSARYIEPIAINISGRSLTNPDFIESFMEMICRRENLCHNLHFEITNTYPISNIEEANRVVQQIRSLGFKVGLDGLGGGNSSLDYLRGIAVDFVKLDGSLTYRSIQSIKDDIILRSFVESCQNLHLKIIGTKVESPLHARALFTVGVDYAQGWYYGRPGPQPLWTRI